MKKTSKAKKIFASISICAIIASVACITASATVIYPFKDMSKDWDYTPDGTFYCYYDCFTGNNNQQAWASTEVKTSSNVYAWAKTSITSLSNGTVSRKTSNYSNGWVKVPAVYVNTPCAMKTQHDGLKAGDDINPRLMWTYTSS